MLFISPALIAAASLCGALSVSVVDEGGAPLSGATVEVLKSWRTEKIGFTDEAGRVQIFPLEAGRLEVLRVRLDGYVDRGFTNIIVRRGEMTSRQVILENPPEPTSLQLGLPAEAAAPRLLNVSGPPPNNSFERTTGLRPVAAQLMIR